MRMTLKMAVSRLVNGAAIGLFCWQAVAPSDHAGPT